MVAAHARQRRQWHVQAVRGLLNGVGQQWVRCEFGEDPIPVLQCGPHRCGEPHRATQVVHPVLGIAHRFLARVESGCGVVRNLRCPGCDVRQNAGQFVEDWIDLGRMRGDIDGDLPGHHVTLLPGCHQLPNCVSCAADHRRRGRGHHRHHRILDAAHGQLREHLLCGKFYRCHGSGAGDGGHQPGATADDAHTVVE